MCLLNSAGIRVEYCIADAVHMTTTTLNPKARCIHHIHGLIARAVLVLQLALEAKRVAVLGIKSEDKVCG